MVSGANNKNLAQLRRDILAAVLLMTVVMVGAALYVTLFPK
jgi:hypothetical protein